LHNANREMFNGESFLLDDKMAISVLYYYTSELATKGRITHIY